LFPNKSLGLCGTQCFANGQSPSEQESKQNVRSFYTHGFAKIELPRQLISNHLPSRPRLPLTAGDEHQASPADD
ncbi:hypothetical protein, partial [Aporhodopirellula aestuarii]